MWKQRTSSKRMLGTTVQIVTIMMGSVMNRPLKTVADFFSVPPGGMPAWMDTDWPANAFVWWWGTDLLALQLCASVALNIPWLGLGVTSGRSIYFTAEDDEAEVHRRIEKLVSQWREHSELSEMKVVSMVGLDALLVTHDTAQRLGQRQSEHIEATFEWTARRSCLWYSRTYSPVMKTKVSFASLLAWCAIWRIKITAQCWF